MNSSTIKIKNFIVPFFLLAGSFLCSAYMLLADLPAEYDLLPYLPLTYFLFLFLTSFFVAKNLDNIGTILLIILTFVRFCLAPVVLVLGNYQTIFKLNLSSYTKSAILLMLFELIVIFLMIPLANHTKKKVSDQVSKKRFLQTNWLGGIIALLTLYCVIVYLIFPSTKMLFRTIFELADEDFTTVAFSSSKLQVGSFQRILNTLFSMFFDFVRLLLPAYLLLNAKKKGKKDSTIIAIALITVVFQFLFITSTFAQSIICALVTLLILIRLCPQKKRALTIGASLFVVAIILIFFSVRFTIKTGVYSGSSWKYISNVVNAYFTGVDNVAASLRVPRENVFTTFLYELYSGIPFHNTLFGWEGEKFQEIFNSVNRSYGQIPPTIGSGYYFFDKIFAPFFSAMLALISIKFSIAANKTEYYFKYMVYTFASIVTALGIAMYDWTIVYSWFTNWILPLLILAYFSKDTFQALHNQAKEELT